MTAALEQAFAAAAQGKSIPSNGWNRHKWGGGRPVAQVSSKNWPLLQAGTGIWADPDTWAPWWVQELTTQTRAGRFMDTECWSRIYALWQSLPVIAAHKWALQNQHNELRYLCSVWLRSFWAFVALGAQPTPPIGVWDTPGRAWRGLAITATGDRSHSRRKDKKTGYRSGPPVHFDRHHGCWLSKRAIYGPSAEGTRSPIGWTGPAGWTWAVVQALERRVGSSVYGLTEQEKVKLRIVIESGHGADEVAGWLCGTISPFTILRTTDGSATVMHRASNSNTAPTYAVTATRVGHRCRMAALAPDPGLRPSPGGPPVISRGRAWIRGGRIHAERGDKKAVKGRIPADRRSIALPPGHRLYTVSVDRNGGRLVEGATSSQQPPPPQPITKDAWSVWVQCRPLMNEAKALAPPSLVPRMEQVQKSLNQVALELAAQ